MTNYKLITIKLGDSLEYGSSVNEINRIALFETRSIQRNNYIRLKT